MASKLPESSSLSLLNTASQLHATVPGFKKRKKRFEKLYVHVCVGGLYMGSGVCGSQKKAEPLELSAVVIGLMWG